jgi:S1-C subfamily serine protease
MSTFAQSLDGYKYVYVPTLTYQNGGTDIWGISRMMRELFSEKGFIVLTESSNPTKDLTDNTCLLLIGSVTHTNVTYGTNEVTLTLTNCKGQTVYSNTGSAMGMTVQDDFNKATRRAFSQIKSLSYSFKTNLTPSIEYPSVEKYDETEESLKSYLTNSNIDPIEGIYKSYQNDQLSYYKFGIIKKDGKYKAIIIESDLKQWVTGEVKSVLENTSMSGFYSVRWYMADKTSVETFGQLENGGLLSIEFTNPQNGEKRQDKFIKMFPPVSGEIPSSKSTNKSSGSGFFITANGLIATNAHVVEGGTKIEVSISNEIGEFTYNAKIALIDKKNDVALLKIDDEKFKGLSNIPFTIIEQSDVGEKVFTIGFPLNTVMGTNFKVTDGIISSKSGIADDVRYLQITVPLQPGNSGGPLFNKDGNVIGLTSSRLNSEAVGTQVENVNYAIKSSYLLTLYNMLPDAPRLPDNSQVASKELQEQVKVLKNYVCLIKIF